MISFIVFCRCYSFSGKRPHFHELDKVSFLRPVKIGDLVRFDAAVLYTSNEMDLQGRSTIHVECTAHVCSPEDATSMKSNVFNFTFGMLSDDDDNKKDGNGNDASNAPDTASTLRTIVPSTEEEARRIVNRMHLDRLQADEDRQNA